MDSIAGHPQPLQGTPIPAASRAQRRRWIGRLTRNLEGLIAVVDECGSFLWDEHPEARDRACAASHILEATYHVCMARQALAEAVRQ